MSKIPYSTEAVKELAKQTALRLMQENASTEYNNWTNRATWAWKLHADNDPSDYEWQREVTRDQYAKWCDQVENGYREGTRADYARWLASELCSVTQESIISLVSIGREYWGLICGYIEDCSYLLTDAVNWIEIADHLIGEFGDEDWFTEPSE